MGAKALKKIDRRPKLVNVVLRLVFQTAPILNYTLALSGVKVKRLRLGNGLWSARAYFNLHTFH